MSRRTPKLSPQDASVVDLVLDHSSTAAGGVTRVTPAVSQTKLIATTKLLNLLDHLTDQDPPAGLAERTLKFIDQAVVQAEARQIGTPMPANDAANVRVH